jgi:hypothetical protein
MPPRPPAQIAVAAVLTAGACLVGGLGWPVPRRTTAGWQVAAVPPSLLVVVLATCGLCLLAGVLLTRPRSLGSPLATLTWWGVAVAALTGQVWNDLYLAALSTAGGGIVPVFGWVSTAVPAALVGLATRGAGREAHLRATLGTGIVTLPPVGLGWAFAAAGGPGDGLAGGLWSAGLLGVLPLALAIAATRPPLQPAAPVG